MRGDVPDRTTGGAKLVKRSIGSVLTENRLDCSDVNSVSDLVRAGDGGIAVRLNLAAGRETPDDEMFTEPTDSNGLLSAGEAVSKVSENRRAGHNQYLSSLYKLRCTHVQGFLCSHESWEFQGCWRVAGHYQGKECALAVLERI